MIDRLRPIAPALVLGVGTLLFLDLFLDWRDPTTVDVAGVVHVEAGESGWAGWGALAGAFLIVLIVLEVLELARPTRLWIPPAVALLGAGALAAIVAAFLDETSVTVGGVVDVTSEPAREWAAYLGVVLACVLAVLALGRLILEHEPLSAPRHPHTA